MANPHQEMWTGALAHVRNNYPALCRGWFDGLEPMPIDNGVFRVRASSAIHRNYLQSQCLDAFADAMQAVTGRLMPVRFMSDEDESNFPGQTARAPSARATPKLDFDNPAVLPGRGSTHKPIERADQPASAAGR